MGEQQQGSAQQESLVGTRVRVEPHAWAHGGHTVARHEGRVLFVRHAIPGEDVTALVTEGDTTSRFLRADAVEVHRAAPERVAPPCPYAGPGLCGGCDLQHVELAAQRRVKAGVVEEQLQRLAGIERSVDVLPVPGDEQGLRWRTRMTFAVNDAELAGLRRHRSNEVVQVDDCLIATDELIASGVLDTEWAGCESVGAVDAAHPDEPVLLPEGPEIESAAAALVGEAVDLGDSPLAGEEPWEYVVTAGGFWQVHRGAARTLVERVLEVLDPRAGEHVLDLYAGAGLFTVPLAERVGDSGAVLAVEGDGPGVRCGRMNTEHLPHVEWRRNDVAREVKSLARQGVSADLVVLDPPRTGAKAAVVKAVAALGPRRIAYVACDPAALARDLATAAECGYELTGLAAYDCFPMTHHVECVATLERKS